MAEPTHDVAYAVALAPIEHPMPAERRVAPNDDVNARPFLAKPFDQQRQYRPGMFRCVDVRGPKVGDQQLLAAEHVQRQVAVPVVVAVEESPRLVTVHRVVGRVEVQHQFLGRVRERGDELLHQFAKELAREFECSASAIRNWVRQADRDQGRREDGLTSSELEELRRLRRELRRVREERDILAKATAWFARETGSVPGRSSGS